MWRSGEIEKPVTVMKRQSAQTKAIWLFDGVCILCSWGVRYTLRHEIEPTIRFVAIQSAEGRRICEEHALDADDPATFLFIEDGVALEKSAGVIALVQHLRGPARMVRLARFLPKALRDFCYDIVARNRYRLFGQTDQCMVPEPQARNRFVLPENAS